MKLCSSAIVRGCVVVIVIVLFFGSCKRRSAAEFVTVKDPVIALTHVRVIDGTGSPAQDDQTIIIDGGRITAIGPTVSTLVPTSAKTLDLSGHTAIPGLVGMHDHLFYSTDRGKRDVVATESFGPLYLASGVTTIRTTGAESLKSDQALKRSVEAGEIAGPKIHLTSPYINHGRNESLTAEQITNNINEWADDGITSFKVYTMITRAELGSVIEAAHKRGLKVTGHLCAVGFVEAARMGIDNLEHGMAVDTEFFSGKKADECPDQSDFLPELARIDVKSPAVQAMIKELVNHHVAVTSTLPIFETYVEDKFQLDSRMKSVLSDDAYAACMSELAVAKDKSGWWRVWEARLQREMEFEREFVRSGGLLMSGVDPTGWGGVIAGFGDQRGVELLVQAGFTPAEAIRIATLNGATFLGEEKQIGSLAPRKQADIVIIRGDPSKNIADIRKVELVFKDGVGYDSAKLIESVHGMVGVK